MNAANQNMTTNVIPLSDFIAKKGRIGVANLFGCTGPALANALRSGRQVWVIEGQCPEAYEISPFPGKGRSVEHHRGTQGLQEDISCILKKDTETSACIDLPAAPNADEPAPQLSPILLTG